jgi:CubicO group peptidase (beta-lactamase class C family)
VETPQTPEGSETRYSFGFFLYEGEGGETLVGHSGSVAGYNAFLVFEPGSGIGVVLLRNYGGGQTNLGEAGRELLNRLLAARLREEG